jgi:hypothetical protein
MALASVRCLLVALGCLMLVGEAHATFSFSPYQCALCPTMTEVPYTFPLRGAGMEIPTDPNCAPTPADPCPHYINWVHEYSRVVLANTWVKKFGFRVDFFETESGWDYFYYGEELGTLASLTGAPPTGWYDFEVSASFERTPGILIFSSDSIIPDHGITIGKGRVCCVATGLGGANLVTPGLRHTGVLLAANDVIYVKASVSATASDSWVLWGDPAGGNDFDIYVRCNALPTPYVYDYGTPYSGSQEYLHVPLGACASPGTWYAAVASYSGSGYFSLVLQRHYETQHRNIRAGTDFAATAPQVAGFKTALAGAARQFYGSTEGTNIIQNISFYNSGNCHDCAGALCDVCFRNLLGTAYCCDHGTQVVILQSYFYDPEGISHEWGHRYFWVGDEYGDTGWRCGHSNMASPWGTQNNFCYNHDSVGQDHEKDKTPGAPPTGLSAAWTVAYGNGLTPYIPYWTPDNYDYRDHDMNGKVGYVSEP